jgi:TP901 family phage tail tape measure protein
MATERKTIEVILTAKDSGYTTTVKKASKVTDDAAKSVDNHQKGMSSLSRGMGVFGAAVTAGLGVAAKASMDFNKELSRAFSATLGTADHTTAGMAKMREAALAASKALPVYSAKESAGALTELLKAGRSLSDVLAGELDSALQLAAADGMELGQATSIMASTMTVFAKSGLTAAQAADTLAAGAGLAQGGVSDLGEAMKYAGPAAAQANMSLQETTGLLATLANNGQMGSMAGTALVGILRNLRTPTQEGATAIRSLGIEVFDAQGKFRGTTTLLEDMGVALAGMSEQERAQVLQKIFDVRALNAANVLLGEATTKVEGGTNALRNMQEQVGQSGYAAQAAADMLDNMAGDWSKFTNTLNIAMIESADGLSGFVRGAIQGATGILEAYNALPSAVKNVATGATVALGGVALAGAGLIKGVDYAKGLRDALVNIGVASDKATKAVKRVGIAAGAIGVALTAGLAIFNHFRQVAEESQNRVNALVETFNSVNGSVQATDATVEQLLKHLQGDGSENAIAASLKEAGISAAETAKAIGSNGDELDVIIEKYRAWANVASQADLDISSGQSATADRAQAVIAFLEQQRDEYQKAGAAAAELAAQENALGTSNRNIAESAAQAAQAEQGLTQAGGVLASGTAELKQQMDEATKEIKNQVDWMYRLRDAYSGMIGSESSWQAALDNMTSAVDKGTQAKIKNKDITDLSNASVRTAEAALRSSADAARAYAEQVVTVTGDETQMQSVMITTASAIIEQGRAWGLTREDLIRYTASITDVPEEVVTRLYEKGSKQAKTEIDKVTTAAKNADKTDPTINVTANTAGARAAIQAVIDSVNRIRNAAVTIAGGRAAGGAIYGPGSGTSDSIPAMLSNGEHVITAREVQAMGGQGAVYRMRAQARAGLLHFASGGAVGISHWQSSLLSERELVALKVRIRDLEADLKEKEDYQVKQGKKVVTKKRDRYRGIDRDLLNAELKEAKQELADHNKAVQMDKAESLAQRSALASAYGSTSSAEIVSSVTAGRGSSVVDMWRELSQDSAITAPTRDNFARQAAQFESDLNKVYTNLDNAQNMARDLQSVYDRVYSDLNQFDLASAAAITHKASIGANGSVSYGAATVTATDIAAQAASEAARLKTFAQKIHELQAAGATPALLQRVAALDPEQGILVADAFLADRDALRSMNSSLASISASAASAGQYVTEASYGGGLAAAQQAVTQLEADVENLGRLMAIAFEKNLGAYAQPRAAGGPVRAGSPYLVGERGPELMVPSISGTIIPNSVINNTAGATYNISIDGVTIGGTTHDVKVVTDFMALANKYRKMGVRRG